MTGTNLLPALGWALINSLWQLALLWVAWQFITAIRKKMSAAAKTSLASALLLTGFAWFLVSFITALLQMNQGYSLGSSPAAAFSQRWLSAALPWIASTYLLLLVIPLLKFIRNCRYVRVIRKYGQHKMPVHWRLFVSETGQRMGIGKKVKIWISDFVSSPVTIGFLKPLILVPAAAISQLTPAQLEAVLLHELAHIRRHDYLLNLLVNIVKTVLYFNPFVKAFSQIIEREREKSCDELVLQFEYDSYDYASALLTLQKSARSPKTLVLPAAGEKNDLLHRVESIMGIERNPFFSSKKIAGLFSVLITVVLIQLFLLLPGRITEKEPAAPLAAVRPAASLLMADNSLPSEQDHIIVSNGVPATADNHLPEPATTPAPAQPDPETLAVQDISSLTNMAFRMAGIEEKKLPELKKFQEVQVKTALDASRRVLQSAQWKQLERHIADAFSEREKQEIKKTYDKKLEQYNWNKVEEQLKLSYSQIDWEQVNTELNSALNQIRLDSIRHVYNDVAFRLAEVQRELSESKLKGIPDTDITVKAVEEKKRKVEESLKMINEMRKKRIVSL